MRVLREDTFTVVVPLNKWFCSQTTVTEAAADKQDLMSNEWLLTSCGVENVDVSVNVGVAGAGHLDKGRCGKDQDVGAGGVLWGVQLGRLHVQRGAATKHWTCRHRIWRDRADRDLVNTKKSSTWNNTVQKMCALPGECDQIQ